MGSSISAVSFCLNKGGWGIHTTCSFPFPEVCGCLEMSGFSSQSLACGKQEMQAICSEPVILGLRLDGCVNLAVFLQPPGLDGVTTQIIQNEPAPAAGEG